MGHTITQKKWWEYPVLNQFNTPFKYKEPHIKMVAKTAIQDGIWVSGYDYDIGTTNCSIGGGCNPGRKWGEYATEKDAEIHAIDIFIKALLRYKEKPESTISISSALAALNKRKLELTQGKQLAFF